MGTEITKFEVKLIKYICFVINVVSVVINVVFIVVKIKYVNSDNISNIFFINLTLLQFYLFI